MGTKSDETDTKSDEMEQKSSITDITIWQHGQLSLICKMFGIHNDI